MAIKVDFNGIKISLPSGEGPCKCPDCGEGESGNWQLKGGFVQYGPIEDENGKEHCWFLKFCYSCPYRKEENGDIRNAYLKRHGRL